MKRNAGHTVRIVSGILCVFALIGWAGCTSALIPLGEGELKYADEISGEDAKALQYAAPLLESVRIVPGGPGVMGVPDTTDFSSLDLGGGIITYQVENGKAVPNGIVSYPVWQDGVIIAVINGLTTGSGTSYVLGSEYINELNSFLKTNQEAVILVDDDYIVIRSRSEAALLKDIRDEGDVSSRPDIAYFLNDLGSLTFTERTLIGRITLPSMEERKVENLP